MNTSNENQVRELLDREQIRDLVHRYCWAVDRGTLEQGACRADKSVLIWVVDLTLMIVIENQFVLPPVVYSKVQVWGDEPFFGQKMIHWSWIEDRVRISRLAFRIDEQAADPQLIVR